MIKKVFLIMVLLVFYLPILQGCGGQAPEAPGVTVEPAAETEPLSDGAPEPAEETPPAEMPRVGIFQGNLAPDFTLYDLEGKQVRLEALRGGQVIVNFWQMSCGPCLAEKKEFQAFLDNYGEEHVTILSINLRDPQPLVEEYMEENGYTFPVLFDTADNFAAVEYRVRATPTNVFIDEQGLVKHRIEGMMNVAFMKDRLGITE